MLTSEIQLVAASAGMNLSWRSFVNVCNLMVVSVESLYRADKRRVVGMLM